MRRIYEMLPLRWIEMSAYMRIQYISKYSFCTKFGRAIMCSCVLWLRKYEINHAKWLIHAKIPVICLTFLWFCNLVLISSHWSPKPECISNMLRIQIHCIKVWFYFHIFRCSISRTIISFLCFKSDKANEWLMKYLSFYLYVRCNTMIHLSKCLFIEPKCEFIVYKVMSASICITCTKSIDVWARNKKMMKKKYSQLKTK